MCSCAFYCVVYSVMRGSRPYLVTVVAVHDVDSPLFVQRVRRPRQKPTDAGLVHLGLWVRKFPEISGGKFPEIYSNISGIFRKFANYLCQSTVFKSSIAKWCCKTSVFLINNSPDLYALTLCITWYVRKNNWFYQCSQQYQRIRMKMIHVMTSRLLL